MMTEQPVPQYNSWRGRKIRLRAWETGDAEALWAEQWDSEAVRGLEAGIQPPRSLEEIREWIRKDAAEAHPHVLRFVVESLDGEAVGWANLRDWQNHDGTFSFAIRIYAAHQHRGYATEAVNILLHYGFHELRCQKANSATISSNDASIEMHLKLGFTQEGCLRRNAYTDGQYWDEILFGITCEEFEERGRAS
jgi:RimJ/RimL family protein N-acetyltransferase